MYERHFGMIGPPFQLSPDPSFFFESSQHRQALSMLRWAFSHEPPILVLSGEIGAGKTTVLRAWFAEAEVAGIAVAQITNTQLDAEGLLGAVATAFGVATRSAEASPAMTALRLFLRNLNGAAAVLSIDEAQNLDAQTLQSLVLLAQAAKEEGAKLRICLAGQPELRTHVARMIVPELQALIQQSCHLGPLEPDQTRQYIEHRLLKVGWTGAPSFEHAAFDEIHRLTGGVPRRINVLANRLMLGQYLNDTACIDRKSVTAVAHALDAEVGEGVVTPDSPRDDPVKGVTPVGGGSLFLLASGRSDYVKAIALVSAITRRRDLPSAVVVGLSDRSPWHYNADLVSSLRVTPELVALFDGPQALDDQVEWQFGRLLQRRKPSAVVFFDGDLLSQRCAEAAARQRVPIVHVGADPQALEERADPQSPRAAISRLAHLRFDCQSPHGGDSLTHNPSSHRVGNLLMDALHHSWTVARRDPRNSGPLVMLREHFDARRGYGVVVLRQPLALPGCPCKPEILSLLREVSRDLPLVWPMRQSTMALARSGGLARTLEGDRIARIEELGHVKFVRLLRNATCVLTDSPDVMEEAAALAVPCLGLGAGHANHVDAGGWLRTVEVGGNVKIATRAVWQILFSGSSQTSLPELWDGDSGSRIAEHLAHSLEESAVEHTQHGTLRHSFHKAETVGRNLTT